jgi:hypothetical protein
MPGDLRLVRVLPMPGRHRRPHLGIPAPHRPAHRPLDGHAAHDHRVSSGRRPPGLHDPAGPDQCLKHRPARRLPHRGHALDRQLRARPRRPRLHELEESAVLDGRLRQPDPCSVPDHDARVRRARVNAHPHRAHAARACHALTTPRDVVDWTCAHHDRSCPRPVAHPRSPLPPPRGLHLSAQTLSGSPAPGRSGAARSRDRPPGRPTPIPPPNRRSCGPPGAFRASVA